MLCRETVFGYQNLKITVSCAVLRLWLAVPVSMLLQLLYTPDHLDLCVHLTHDDTVSIDTHGVKPDNIFNFLDEWLPKGQRSELCDMLSV